MIEAAEEEEEVEEGEERMELRVKAAVFRRREAEGESSSKSVMDWPCEVSFVST